MPTKLPTLTFTPTSFGRISYYSEKCQEHLSRVRVSHVLALCSLRGDSEGVRKANDLGDLIKNSFAGPVDEAKQAEKLREIVHEQHLVGLKANFELYLSLVLTSLVTHHGKAIADKMERLESDSLTLRMRWNRMTRTPCETPSPHRLCRAGDWESWLNFWKRPLESDSQRCPKCPTSRKWSTGFRFQTAFHVRHLVEHRDNKVDAKFRRDVSATWRRSTGDSATRTYLSRRSALRRKTSQGPMRQ